MDIPSNHYGFFSPSDLVIQDEEPRIFGPLEFSSLEHETSISDLARCGDCGQEFIGSNRSTNLRRHIKSIHGSNYIRCEIGECDEEFTRSDNLKAHVQLKHTATEADRTKGQMTLEADDVSAPEPVSNSALTDSMESRAPSRRMNFNQMREARAMRAAHACWRCKFQRQRCDIGSPCSRCVNVFNSSGNGISALSLALPCYRGDLLDLVQTLTPYESLQLSESALNQKDGLEDQASLHDMGTIFTLMENSSNPFSTSTRLILEMSHDIAMGFTAVQDSDSVSLVADAVMCLHQVMDIAQQGKGPRLGHGKFPQISMTIYLRNLSSTLQTIFKLRRGEEQFQEKWIQIFASLFILNLILCIQCRVLEYDQQSLKFGYDLIVGLFALAARPHGSLRETGDVRNFALTRLGQGKDRQLMGQLVILCDRLQRMRGSFFGSPENFLRELYAAWSAEVPINRSNESPTSFLSEHSPSESEFTLPGSTWASEGPLNIPLPLGTSRASKPFMHVELAQLDTPETFQNQLGTTSRTENQLYRTPSEAFPQIPIRQHLDLHSLTGDSPQQAPSLKLRRPLPTLSTGWEQILTIWQQRHPGRTPNEAERTALSIVTETDESEILDWFSGHQNSGLQALISSQPSPQKVDRVRQPGPANTCLVRRRVPKPWNKSRDPDKPYSCLSRCGWTFTKKGDWIKHEKITHPEESFGCPAPYCAEWFGRKDKLRNHIRSVHVLDPEDLDLESRRTLLQDRLDDRCGFCGQYCKSWQEWYDHVGAHFEERIEGGPWTMNRWTYPWIEAENPLEHGAEQTDKQESDPTDLEPEDPGGRDYNVPSCGSKVMATAAVKTNLTEGTESASKLIRKYQCSVCSRAFIRKGERDKHERIHEPKAWKCPHMGCTAVLSRKDKLREHMKMLHKDVPHQTLDHFLKKYNPKDDHEGDSNGSRITTPGREVAGGGVSVGSSNGKSSTSRYRSTLSGSSPPHELDNSLDPSDLSALWSSASHYRSTLSGSSGPHELDNSPDPSDPSQVWSSDNKRRRLEPPEHIWDNGGG